MFTKTTKVEPFNNNNDKATPPNTQLLDDENKQPKESPSLATALKLVSSELIGESTMHGLPHVFRKSQIYLKIIWAFFFICSAGACGYITYNYISTYIKFETNVNVAILYESPVDFPAVTFCNLNPFNTRNIWTQNYINSVLAANDLSYLMNLNRIQPNETAFILASKALSVLRSATASNSTINASTRKSYGFQLNEMLLSCRFNGKDCSSADFKWFQSYQYGNCYTFNSGKNDAGNNVDIQKVSQSGVENGLSMEIFTGDSARDEKFIWSSGIYLVVQNQSITPLMESEGAQAAAGYETNIAIKRTFTKKEPYPYSNCLEANTDESAYNSPLYKAMFQELNETTYRQRYCYRLCYQQNVIKDCSCSDPSLPSPFSKFGEKPISKCQSTTEATCMAKTKTTFQNSPISGQCETDCPLECSTISYTSEISLSTFPTAFYSNWLMLQSNLIQRFQNNVTSQSGIKASVAKVNIFYNDMSYTTITESPSITWDVLLGNIGGQLGLFLGMSILSFVEIVEFIFELFRTCLCFRKIKRAVSQS